MFPRPLLHDKQQKDLWSPYSFHSVIAAFSFSVRACWHQIWKSHFFEPTPRKNILSLVDKPGNCLHAENRTLFTFQFVQLASYVRCFDNHPMFKVCVCDRDARCSMYLRIFHFLCILVSPATRTRTFSSFFNAESLSEFKIWRKKFLPSIAASAASSQPHPCELPTNLRLIPFIHFRALNKPEDLYSRHWVEWETCDTANLWRGAHPSEGQISLQRSFPRVLFFLKAWPSKSPKRYTWIQNHLTFDPCTFIYQDCSARTCNTQNGRRQHWVCSIARHWSYRQ